LIYGLFVDLTSIAPEHDQAFLDALCELANYDVSQLLSLGGDCCFYVGRTTDLDRRYKQHQRAKGGESKYQLIRLLDELAISWYIDELDDVCEYTAQARLERLGHPIVNDKTGDLNRDEMERISAENQRVYEQQRSVMAESNAKRRARTRHLLDRIN